MCVVMLPCITSMMILLPGRLIGSRSKTRYDRTVFLSESNDLQVNRSDDSSSFVDLSASRQDFDAGLDFGKGIASRFISPVIDDPGLPYADMLVVMSGTLVLSILILSSALPVPLPGWLTPLPGMEGLRGLPYILPAIEHGSGLALCWLLGAVAARAFESEAYSSSLGNAIKRTWSAGAFAIGILLMSTQLGTFIVMTIDQQSPFLGDSIEADMRLVAIANEVILDCFVQAIGLTLFRIYRWWDAQSLRR